MNRGRGPQNRRLRRPTPTVNTGYRTSRRGNLVPLGPLPPRIIPRVPRAPRRNNQVNRRIPNTYLSRPSGTRRQNDNLVLTKQEYWFSVEPGVHKYTFIAGRSGIPHLDRLAAVHESVQVRHFKIHYRPSAGTDKTGNLTLGVDYQPENDRKQEDIKILDTNVSGTIFTSASIKLIVNRMQKNVSWLGTAAASNPHSYFALYVDAATDATSVGQIWVSYKVSFSDPTSPSGSVVLNKQNVATVSSQISSDVMTESPNVLTVGPGTADKFLEVSQPTKAKEIDEKGTQYETIIDINEQMPTGTDFTIGSSFSTPASYATHMYRASQPKITFKYADGTPIPDGTIEALAQHSPVKFESDGMQSDIFASIFRLLKPLAKPAWGLLSQLVEPLISFSPSNGVQSSDPVEFPSDQLTSFAFVGDTATISVPVTDKDAILSRYPVTIMQSAGHGYAKEVYKYVQVFSHNLLSHPNSWVASVSDGGGSGYETQLTTIFRHPDKKTAAFQLGDLMSIFVTAIPIEQGIGDTIHTPFAAPFTDEIVQAMIKVLETSTLSQNESLDPDAPKLKILSVTNQSKDTGPGKTVGAWMTGRFVSTFAEKAYKNAVIKFPIGYTMTGVDIEGSLFGIKQEYFKTAGLEYLGYNMALAILTFQFFPTASAKLPVMSKEHSFQIQRTNDDILVRSAVQQQRIAQKAKANPIFADPPLSDISDSDEE